ncbi:MAG: ATP-binding cassette domain-containing protein [Marivibrio sp.]|uniref:ATP-binding cassette domain-containing protein n=1 Tax=Marivibrio sp. TaxID=2039719 RepID=UPI0032EAF186
MAEVTPLPSASGAPARGPAGPGERLVALSGAGVSRGGRWLVRGVDLEIARGEIVTLIGPNGSGKSTTAKLALGVLGPDEGGVTLGRGVRVGYVPQRLAIDWTVPLTVARLMRLTAPLGRDETRAALTRTGVAHLAAAEVQTLSGGEFQRVLLARAIARKPDLLVLDEPVQGVDFTGELALYDLIAGVAQELNCGVLLISHDLHVVMAQTDRVICLNGHICCQGTPHAVAESAEYRRLFGRRAAEALAVYEHAHDHTHLLDGRVRLADGTIVESCDHEHGASAPPAGRQAGGGGDA